VARRNLPDEKLHDLLHRLGNLQKELNNVITEIYIHVEVKEERMPFTGSFKAEKVSPKTFMILEDYSYTTPENETYTVPKGFITDGASIPSIAWPIVGSPFTGRYTMAAGIHDVFYVTHEVNRKKADKIFLLGMKDLGVSWWRRKLMGRCVRLFGGFLWNRRKK